MRRALVIGNSDGIGLALTRRLLDEGWTVRGLSRSDSPLSHASYSHVRGDVVTAAIPSDPVDLCVYAAGVGELLDLGDLAAQTRAIEVNLLGAARTVEAVVPAMVAAGSGHLVGLSSLADVVISADAPGYAASKAGLTAYLLGLRAALRPHGVAVTAVRFGFVDTKMAKGASRPLMIAVDEAVEVLMRGIRRRPAVISYPRRVSAAARLIRLSARATLR